MKGLGFAEWMVILLLVMIIAVGLIPFAYHDDTFEGESYYQDETNPTLYYVYVHKTEDPSERYMIETSSKIYAERLSQIRDTELAVFTENGYVKYNKELLPIKKIEQGGYYGKH